MPVLLAILALFFPRFIIILLYFFSDFFIGVYDTFLIPILGFFFMPITLIAYTYAFKNVGVSSTTGLILITIAVVADLGLWKKGAKRKK